LGKNRELHELALKELKSFSNIIEADIFDILSTAQMISRRKSIGGTATENVRAAIKAAKECLHQEKKG
jgi:argininosuccinate lyase